MAHVRAGVEEGTRQSVLDILGPLTTAYVQRATGGRPNIDLPHHDCPPRTVSGPYTPCFVEAVVTVDAEGRISWPRDLEPGVRRVAIDLADGPTLAIVIEPQMSSRVQAVDRRGRILLPAGILQAARIRPGDRLTLIRRPERDGFALAPAGCLGVRQGLE